MLHSQETFLDVSTDEFGVIFGETDVYETYCETFGELYRVSQQEYGRCTGKIYIDTDEGPKHVGWVFVSRQQYTDCNATYLREVWVTAHEKPPTTTTEYHYA